MGQGASREARATKTIAIFGDVGGHLLKFAQALERLGVDTENDTIPDDLVIIQIGDLVHRGPSSDALVAFADRFMKKYPKQWIQLFGNHEGNHIGGPEFMDPKSRLPYILERQTILTLRRWRYENKAKAAVALHTEEYGDMLVTHGGLTSWYWKHWRGKTDVAAMAKLLNTLPTEEMFRPGEMLGSPGIPGVVWASANETASSWIDMDMPFSQVHGHSTLFWWSAGKFSQYTHRRVRELTEVDKEKRHEVTKIGEKVIFGIDPAFGYDEPHHDIHPLVVHGEVL